MLPPRIQGSNPQISSLQSVAVALSPTNGNARTKPSSERAEEESALTPGSASLASLRTTRYPVHVYAVLAASMTACLENVVTQRFPVSSRSESSSWSDGGALRFRKI